jgi:hypothetical protein
MAFAETIRFVDEEHASERLLENLPRLRTGLRARLMIEDSPNEDDKLTWPVY